MQLLAPGQWRPDGKLALADERSSRFPGLQRHRRRERCLHALSGVLEEQGTASVPQLMEGLAVRLPVSELPSAESARGLLRAERAIFTEAGRGWHGLVAGAADGLLLDRSASDSLWGDLNPILNRSGAGGPVYQLPKDVLSIVTSISGITPETLQSPPQLRSVGQVRAVSAHLLRKHCQLRVKDVAPLLGRSDQTVGECSLKARVAFVHGGRIAELIHQTELVLEGGAPRAVASSSFKDAHRDDDTLDDAAIGENRASLPVPRSIVLTSLRDWRTHAGLTQPQLARRVGVARETISRMEHGRPATRAVAHKLADALQVSLDALKTAHPVDAESRGHGAAGSADRRRISPLLEWSIPMPHLRHWRTLGSLTQPQLAARAGTARETIARIEKGRPAWRPVVFRLAAALQVAPSVLTGATALDGLTGKRTGDRLVIELTDERLCRAPGLRLRFAHEHLQANAEVQRPAKSPPQV